MSILLAPLQAMYGGQAPLVAIRLYMLAVNFVLIGLIIRELGLLGVGRAPAGLCMLACCLSPFYLVFLSALWADLVGVLMGLLFLVHLERLIIREQLGQRSVLLCALLLSGAALVRPQYLFLAPIALVRFLLLHFQLPEVGSLARLEWRKLLWVSVLLCAPLFLVLGAWNSALQSRFGDSFLVTSTQLTELFESADFRRESMETTRLRSPYAAVHEVVLERSKKAGISFSEQAALERSKLSTKTREELFREQLNFIGEFYFLENFFLRIILMYPESWKAPQQPFVQRLLMLNSVIWMGFLCLGLLAFCLPSVPHGQNHLATFSLKSIAFLLMLQPHLGPTHGRYHASLMPVFSLLIFLTVRARVKPESLPFAAGLVYRRLVWAGQAFAATYGLVLLAGLVYVWIYLRPLAFEMR